MKRGKMMPTLVVSTLVALFVGAPAAQANHHLMRIREIYPGTQANPDSAYVELQMYSAGENIVNGQSIRTYNAQGMEIHSFAMTSNVPNAQNQRTILIGDQFPPNAVSADFTDLALGTNIVPTGGAVCFTSTVFGPIDCASWGSFNGNAMLPSSAGTTAPVIPDGDGLTRSIAPGCATLLEAADDTNQSATDFSLTTAANLDPRPNSVTPTETPCVSPKPPSTKLTQKPKSKTTDRTPTFKFKSTPGGASFQCKLDKGSFKSCDSPETTTKLGFGKHTFQVRAKNGNGADKSPAKATFKVVKS